MYANPRLPNEIPRKLIVIICLVYYNRERYVS